MPKGPRSFDMSAEALEWATQQGFMSLDVEEVPLSTFEMRQNGEHGDSMEGRSEKGAKKKQGKKEKVEKGRKKRVEGAVTSEEVASHEPSSAGAKRKRKDKASSPAEDHVEQEESVDVGGDLFASLVQEIASRPKNPPARAVPLQTADAATGKKAKKSEKAKKAAAEAVAIQADEDEDDDQAVEDSDEEGGDGEQEEQEQGEEAEEATEGASKPMDPSAALEAAQLGWREFGLHDELVANLARSGFVGPTPIQTACLPAAMHGRRDVVGAAETGSGKTLAFGLPILHRLLVERDQWRGVSAAVSRGEGKGALEKVKKRRKVSGGIDNTAEGALTAARSASKNGVFALILCPTRELAHQVASHLHAVAPDDVGICSLVGGMSVDKQRRLLSRHPEIIVATPGRLWELASDGETEHLRSLPDLRFFVMDEVDRMVEAGHFKELRSILALLERRAAQEEMEIGAGGGGEGGEMDEEGEEEDDEEEDDEDEEEDEEEDKEGAAGSEVKQEQPASTSSAASSRQTFLFSATLMLPPNAKVMNAKRLSKHKATRTDSTMDQVLRLLVFRNELKVLDLSRAGLVAAGLEQAQLSCTRDEKDAFLLLLLRTRMAHGRTIVFTNAVTALVRLRSVLALLGFGGNSRLFTLQGNMQQRARLKALDRFKASTSAVLLATDVAARGLDISGVDHVVHFQLPRSAEVYVHRSGRTARGQSCGLSVALVEPADLKAHRRLCHEIGEPNGLKELEIDAKLLPKVREVVSIARQLDKAAHITAKKSHASQMRKKLAEEMGLPSDSDDDDKEDGGDVARRQERKRQQERERLHAKLKALLARLERPTGVRVHEAAAMASKGATW